MNLSMVTNLAIALAISLTGQVEDDKVCYKKCTRHNDNVIHLDVKYHPDNYTEKIKEWVCQGEAEGFKHTITNELTCDGSNHEGGDGKKGECYVCY